jgi:threonine dehydratase
MNYAQQLSSRDDILFVHAYADHDIVAGQGTLGLEIHEQVPEADTVIVPIGGGGLIGGISTALAEVAPEVRVVGVQAADAATVPQSLDNGAPVSLDDPDTIADGIATGSVSDLTLSLIKKHVDEVMTVPDGEIARAILLLLERAKQLVEGAGAASVSALLSEDLDVSGEPAVPYCAGQHRSGPGAGGVGPRNGRSCPSTSLARPYRRSAREDGRHLSAHRRAGGATSAKYAPSGRWTAST